MRTDFAFVGVMLIVVFGAVAVVPVPRAFNSSAALSHSFFVQKNIDGRSDPDEVRHSLYSSLGNKVLAN